MNTYRFDNLEEKYHHLLHVSLNKNGRHKQSSFEYCLRCACDRRGRTWKQRCSNSENFRDVPEDMRSLLGQISISHFDRHLGFKHIVGFFQFCKGKGLIGWSNFSDECLPDDLWNILGSRIYFDESIISFKDYCCLASCSLNLC